MRLLVVLAVGCAGAGTTTPGWRPAVWTRSPPDPQSQVVVLPIAGGQTGTELVIAALGAARKAGATGLGDIELQVGTCIREIAVRPAAPLVDPVVFETAEPELTCKRAVDLQFDPSPPSGFEKAHIHDSKMVEHEDCQTAPRRRFVTRERADVDERFSPPRWSTVAQWSGLALHAGPLHCDARDERRELRMRLHFGPAAASAPPSPSLSLGPSDPAAIVALVARARTAADPSADAERALALWRAGDFDAGLPREAVAAIAEAAYLAAERDAARFVAQGMPAVADVAWMNQLDDEIARFAARYQAIGDAVRAPEATRWLRAGAQRLAEMHAHVADLYEQLGRAEAARQHRLTARVLAAQGAGEP